jgi:hypothetical protein
MATNKAKEAAIKDLFQMKVSGWWDTLIKKNTRNNQKEYLRNTYFIPYTQTLIGASNYDMYMKLSNELIDHLNGLVDYRSRRSRGNMDPRFYDLALVVTDENIKRFRSDLGEIKLAIDKLLVVKPPVVNNTTQKYRNTRKRLDTNKKSLNRRINELKSDHFYQTYYSNNGTSKVPVNATRMNFGTGMLPIMGNASQRRAANTKKAELNSLLKELADKEKEIDQLERNYTTAMEALAASREAAAGSLRGGTRKKKRTPK